MGAEVTLSLLEIAGVVAVAVTLASSDPAALSRLFITAAAKRLGVAPREIVATTAATDDRPADVADDGSAPA